MLLRWPRVPGSMIHIREIRAEARIALYEGRGRLALRCVEEGMSALRRTGLILARAQTSELGVLRALSALSIGDTAAAERHTRALEGLAFLWTRDAAMVTRAGLAHRAGDLGGAIVLLERARRHARQRGEALWEQTMTRRLGEWTVGREGRALVDAADAWMSGQGIAEPERMTAMLLGWV